MKSQQCNVRLSPELLLAARRLAKADGYSLSEVVRALITAWVDAKVVAYGGHKDE